MTTGSRIRPAKFEGEGHRYTENGVVVPSVTQVCASVGLFDLSGARKSDVERKQDLGTEAHYCCALVDRGEKLSDYEIDPRVVPYVDSYMEFKEAKQWKPVLVEHGPFIADVNGMPVGFTLDRVGNLDGREAVGEIKCTASDEPYHGCQLAGYDLCLGEVKRIRFVIRCQPDGRMAKLKEYTDQSEYGVFAWALAITHWKINKKVETI